MKPTYDTTLARIAGNIAAGLVTPSEVHAHEPEDRRAAIVEVAVDLARAIVARVKAATDAHDDTRARTLAELEARHAAPATDPSDDRSAAPEPGT